VYDENRRVVEVEERVSPQRPADLDCHQQCLVEAVRRRRGALCYCQHLEEGGVRRRLGIAQKVYLSQNVGVSSEWVRSAVRVGELGVSSSSGRNSSAD
jgi:hypothetical protein